MTALEKIALSGSEIHTTGYRLIPLSMIQKAKTTVVKPAPYHGDRSESGYHRQKKERMEKGAAPNILVQHHREHKGNSNGERNLNNGIDESIYHRLPGLAISEKLRIMIEPDKNITPAEVANFEKTLPQSLKYGNDIEYREPRHSGGRQRATPTN
jgi:hypothetical protein